MLGAKKISRVLKTAKVSPTTSITYYSKGKPLRKAGSTLRRIGLMARRTLKVTMISLHTWLHKENRQYLATSIQKGQVRKWMRNWRWKRKRHLLRETALISFMIRGWGEQQRAIRKVKNDTILGNYDMAISLLSELLEEVRMGVWKSPDQVEGDKERRIASITFHLANSHYRKKNLEKAIEYYSL